MQKILVVVGSIRPTRVGDKIADWFMSVTKQYNDIQFDLVDLKEINLPFLDELLTPSTGKYEKDHTKKWAEIVANYDGYVFVTPEYNHGAPASLKNALDFLGPEWAKKPIAFVGYGGHLGLRSVEQLRLSVINLDLVPINAQVEINSFAQIDDKGVFTPTDKNIEQAHYVIKKIKWWAEALSAARKK